jgi:hypothetical protein
MSAPDLPPPALIRLVTGRYYEMQGLTTLADAVLPIHFGLVYAFFYSGASESLWLLVTLLLIPMVYWLWARYTWVRRRIDAFYNERCGRVTAVIGLEYNGFFIQATMALPVLIPAGTPSWALALVALGLLSIHPLWIVRRDWPYRTHWLLPAAVGVVAALMMFGVRTKEEAFAWQMRLLLAGGASLAVVGMLDHRLLVRTLRPAADPLAAEEPQER